MNHEKPVKTRHKTIRRESARAIVLAFLTAGATRTTAAKAAGISLRTLERMIDPGFRVDLASARSAAYSDALGGIRGAAGRAVECLAALLGSKREGTRLRSAIEVIGLAMKANEATDLEPRLAALEKIAREMKNRAGATEDVN